MLQGYRRDHAHPNDTQEQDDTIELQGLSGERKKGLGRNFWQKPQNRLRLVGFNRGLKVKIFKKIDLPNYRPIASKVTAVRPAPYPDPSILGVAGRRAQPPGRR